MTPEVRSRLNADLSRLSDGDRSAATPVFEALWPAVRDFAARAVGDDAQDMAQQALLKVFEQAASYDRSRDALAWALAIAGWEVKTELKRRARRREQAWEAAAEQVASSGATADESLDDARFRAAVEAAARSLSEADRTTLAEALAETGGGATWRKRKERALTRLRAAMRRIHGE